MNTRVLRMSGRAAAFLPVGFAALGGLSSSACSGHSKSGAAGASAANASGSGGDRSGMGGAGLGGANTGANAGASGAGSAGVSGANASAPGAGGNGGSAPNAAGTSGSAGGGASTTAGGAMATGGTDPCPALPAAPIPANAITQFNDNGAWNWFQDERVVVDRVKNKFVIGSVASGGDRDGHVEAVVYDVATGMKQLFTLGTSLEAYPDDHNAPAFLVRPDGKYFAMWAGHRLDCYSRTSIFDGSAWSPEARFDWTSVGCPWLGSDTYRITYANPWYIGGAIFAAARSVDTTPALLTSTDDGKTLSYYGRLVATPNAGFVAGYYKYWGNNTDRIDFVGTEAHPRDANTSLWHGYLKGGKIFDSNDSVVDDNAGDGTAQPLGHFTQAVATGVTLGSVTLDHLWNHDIARYADGTIAILGQGRVMGSRTDDPDLRLIYARFDGTSWHASYLGKAGHKLFADEQDYTGLGALHPETPNVIFISTSVDPRDDTTLLSRHELFEGVTCDGGTTWHWAPLTQGSKYDNIRPIAPKWDASHTLLLWLNGTYTTSQLYRLSIVGSTAL